MRLTSYLIVVVIGMFTCWVWYEVRGLYCCRRLVLKVAVEYGEADLSRTSRGLLAVPSTGTTTGREQAGRESFWIHDFDGGWWI
jgi:hypothetical protein